MSKREKQLKVFAKWLKEYKYTYSEYDGKLENYVGYAIEKSTNQIGEYLEEILEMNDEQLDNEI